MRPFLYFLLILFYNSVNSQCVKSITAGAEHSVMIKSDGTLWTWGRNTNGQLGNNTTNHQNVPIQIGADTDWKRVGQLQAYINASFIIKDDNSLWSMGENLQGQLGLGISENILVPTQVSGSNWKICRSIITHTLAIKHDGTLWGWGENNGGQVGDGSLTIRLSPVQIGVDTNWKDITVGDRYSLAIKDNGTLWAWGKILHLAIDSHIPMQIGNATDWDDVDAGLHFAIAKKTDGTIWSWGHPSNGAVGQNTDDIISTLTQIGTETNWRSIHVAAYRTFAIKNDGTLWGCGQNFYGELGDGTTINHKVLIQIGDDTDWKEILPGAAFTLGIKDDGSVWIWGRNLQGALGDGSGVDNYIPHPLIECVSEEEPEKEDNCGCACISYTNPVSAYLTISTKIQDVQPVTIYDMTGKQIFKVPTNQQVYVGNLARAMYIIKIECGGQKYYRKFIKD